jgi:L-threonylcarbamoyladenylate synthase
MTKEEIIKAAAEILHNGGLVSFPTETVYGLGADASNEAAVRKIFAAKERPYDHPLIVHLADLSQLSRWAREVSPAAQKLAEAFWPGPLTMILKKQPEVLDIVTGHQDSIGLRIPRHPIAKAILQEFGGGIAAPSANKFTHISPTTAEAVREELGDKVDLILDGGECAVGLESTIIDLSHDTPVILRPGMITAEMLEKVLGTPVKIVQKETLTVRAPGSHHLHYAPVTATIVLSAANIPDFLYSLQPDDLPAALVTHSQTDFPELKKIHRVKLPADAADYAHDLYRTLRALDNLHFQCIVIEDVPEEHEWDAIRDRLNKASGRRV